MYVDAELAFGLPTIANSTAATVSPFVHDAQSAVSMFAGVGEQLALWFRATVTADANPTVLVDLIGADNAALTSNPILIASSGIIATKDGLATALASGDTVERKIPISSGQQVKKRYYGLMVTLGGTNPDLAANQDAYIVRNAQTNMPGARAAIPA